MTCRRWLPAGLAALVLGLSPLETAAHSDASSFSGTAGVHDHPVETMEDIVRYPARVIVDPRKVVNVTMRVNARITEVTSGAVGSRVRAGDILAHFTSAELKTLQTSYIESWRARDLMLAASVTAQAKLLEARMNLQWRGLSESDIDQIELTRRPVEQIALVAPADGYLTQVNIGTNSIVNAGTRAGLFTAAGTPVFQIADLGAKLILAELPAEVAAGIAPGDELRLMAPGASIPEQAAARVEAVLPVVPAGRPWTRTVRLVPGDEVARLLRPGQAVTVLPPDASAPHEEHSHD
ncbi:Barrel-sandwich domain of CusB or HlyD membrane-fusion [Paracoccus thiocyanatus]|uniref:Barrel-sandwich domain of CusB or HlyD membrane-fusion n=1 Tax=Paracoccus thiocyanatus TaxID=34006 RepID=A0A1N6P367_9RHOB|nr:efflux RND transporter periplasmic adaptor subunit [Paracoccus thiocyanatus]SIP98697.1 Barrel-sandwich domain of CusB or HlyD membrane-fusion [Paracoccus thiocyanatus]